MAPKLSQNVGCFSRCAMCRISKDTDVCVQMAVVVCGEMLGRSLGHEGGLRAAGQKSGSLRSRARLGGRPDPLTSIGARLPCLWVWRPGLRPTGRLLAATRWHAKSRDTRLIRLGTNHTDFWFPLSQTSPRPEPGRWPPFLDRQGMPRASLATCPFFVEEHTAIPQTPNPTKLHRDTSTFLIVQLNSRSQVLDFFNA